MRLGQWGFVVAMVLAATSACAFKLAGLTPTEAFPGIHGLLVQAAVDGDAAAMERLVEQGADPNYHNSRGGTPLAWVTGAKNHRGLEKLLELGADPNAPVFNSTMVLEIAGGNDFEMLRIILEHGGDPNKAVGCDMPLGMVVDLDDATQRIDLLLAHGANINGLACGSGAPTRAAVIARFNLVLYMLAKGYNANLDELAGSVNRRLVPKDSHFYQEKMQVLEILRQRGAKIPPPAQ